MIRRSSIIVIEALLGIVAGLTILVGIVLWRLSAEPVSLDFLTPHLERAFSAGRAERIEVGQTLLSWSGDARELDLVVRDVEVIAPDGATLAKLPQAAVTLSLRALLHGQFAAIEVGLSDVAVALERTVEGDFVLGADTAGDGSGEDLDFAMTRLMDVLMVEDDPARPLSFLQRVTIRNGRLSIEDRRLGISWNARDVDIEVHREGETLAAELDFGWRLGERTAELSLGLDYAVATGDVGVDLAFIGLPLSGFVEAIWGVQLPLMDLGLNGSVTGTIDDQGRLGTASFEVETDAGQIGLAGVVEPPLPVRGLRANGLIESEGQRLVLEAVEVRLGRPDQTSAPAIIASGSLSASEPLLGGDLAATLQVSTEAVPMADLGRYWPATLAANARAWPLENMTAGEIRQARASVALEIPGGAFDRLAISELDGSLDYSDLTIHFLRPLPPILGVSGSARFDQSQFRFDAKGGRLGEITVGATSVLISGLDSAQPDKGVYETMTVESEIAAPVRATLELIDHPRLDLLANMDFSPEDAAGQAQIDARFEFPLMAELPFERIAIDIGAEIADATLRQAVLDRDITDGSLTLDLTEAGMTVEGSLRLAGVPATATWRENFTDRGDFRTAIEATVPQLGDEGRDRLGLALPGYLEGPLSASLNLVSALDGRTEVQTALNLQETSLELGPLAWAKPAGVPGEGRATLQLGEGGIERVSAFRLEASDLLLVGAAEPASGGAGLAQLFLSQARVHRSDLRDVTVDLTGAGPRIEIAGGTLDAYPYLREEEAADAAAAPTAADRGTAGKLEDQAEPAPREYEPFSLRSAPLIALLIDENSRLEGVTLELERQTAGWSRLLLDAQIPQELWNIEREGVDVSEAQATTPRRVRVDYQPAADGGQTLTASSNDFGALLRAIDVIDEIQGGRLEITGRSEGPIPTHPFEGRIESKAFVVYDVPVLARLMTLASFDGIASALTGEGITFERLVGDFRVEDEKVSTKLLRAYGSGVGLTSEGTLDFAADRLNLKGTVVPAYTVNRILGGIPLIGTLLTGGEGQGLIAVTYTITGPLDAPQVVVNPLSALTPGFLRGIFTEGTDTPAEAIPEPPNR